MNSHSYFPVSIVNLKYAAPHIGRLFLLVLLCGLLQVRIAEAQTRTERTNLVTALNGAMAAIVSLRASDPGNPHTVPVTLPAGITVKGYTGTCTTPISASMEYDPANPGGIRLVVTLRNASTMDIPEFAHDLVCHLNVMIWHLFNGNLQQNWIVDEAGSVILQPRNFDVNCSGGATQKFWMIDEDEEYPPDDEKMIPLSAGLMWSPPWSYDSRILDLVGSSETDGEIRGTDFVLQGNADKHVWIVRRHPAADGRMEAKRAYTRAEFDYDYYEPNSTTVSTLHDYIEVDPATNPWGYTKKLTAITLEARPHGYGSDQCPQSHPTIQPLTSSSELKMTLNWIDASGTGTTTCVESWTGLADNDNENLWQRLNGDRGRQWGEFDIDANGVLYFELTGDCNGAGTPPQRFGLVKLRDRTVPADRCEFMLGLEGLFSLDDKTGEIIYTFGATTDRVFCFDFCETLSGYLTFDNVISASVQTFADTWEYDPAIHGTWDLGETGNSPHYDQGEAFDPYFGMPDNPFQRAERGRWRPDKAYTYRSNVKSGVGSNRVYDAAGAFVDASGSTADAFRLFNWRDPADNIDKWLNPVQITRYTPSGESLEEKSILDIYGTSKLAHDETVPRLVAVNATYNAVDFESFEDRRWWANWDSDPGNVQEWHPQIDQTHAHSGEVSFHLYDNGDYSYPACTVLRTEQIGEKGLLVKVWVKQSYNSVFASTPFTGSPIGIKVGTLPAFTTLAPAGYNTLNPGYIHKVAKTGEWTLYQLIVAASDLSGIAEDDPLPITVKNNIPALHDDDVWIDDIRVQPLDAEMTCFVYDRNTLRLIGQFDDQHFGVYSRYNGEGNVVSVLRETERGLVTVTESHGWVMSQLRYPGEPGSSISSPSNDNASRWFDQSGFDSPAGPRAGRAADFDIASLHIGPEGPTVDLLGRGRMPLEDLQELLDFRADFSQINTESLAVLVPDIPEPERLQLVRDLMALDKERAELEKEMRDVRDADKEKQLRTKLDGLNAKRDAILQEKLGLTPEEVETFYRNLDTDSGSDTE